MSTKLTLWAVRCRVEPVVAHPAPPQTRTCAMHASGSSGRATATRLQSAGLLLSGLVSSMSLPCLPPADALPDGAFPPVGRLGLTSPLSSVLCAATTATSPSQGASLVARHPDTLPASMVCGVPEGLVTRGKLQATPGLLVTRSPNPGMQQGDRWLSQVPELPLWTHAPLLDPGGVLHTCHSAYRTVAFRPLETVGFPLDYRLRDILFVHDYTHFGAQSRGLRPRYTRLRTAPYGEARGFATDRLARR